MLGGFSPSQHPFGNYGQVQCCGGHEDELLAGRFKQAATASRQTRRDWSVRGMPCAGASGQPNILTGWRGTRLSQVAVLRGKCAKGALQTIEGSTSIARCHDCQLGGELTTEPGRICLLQRVTIVQQHPRAWRPFSHLEKCYRCRHIKAAHGAVVAFMHCWRVLVCRGIGRSPSPVRVGTVPLSARFSLAGA